MSTQRPSPADLTCCAHSTKIHGKRLSTSIVFGVLAKVVIVVIVFHIFSHCQSEHLHSIPDQPRRDQVAALVVALAAQCDPSRAASATAEDTYRPKSYFVVEASRDCAFIHMSPTP